MLGSEFLKNICVLKRLIFRTQKFFTVPLDSQFVLDETHWHRINAEVASHVLSLLAQWRVPQFAPRHPCNAPPPPPHRHLVTVSPPAPGYYGLSAIMYDQF